jgi:hypothetical protein
VPGFKMTRLWSHCLACDPVPADVTMPTPSARRGTPKVVPGYRCWRMNRSRWLRAAAVREMTVWGVQSVRWWGSAEEEELLLGCLEASVRE